MTDLDDLVRGAWDLHCHCYPELSLEHRARQDDVELVSAIVGASLEAMRAAADMGAYIEFTCLQMMSLRHPLPPRQVAETIEALGDHRCVLTTDAFNAWAPPEPELLRWGVGVLRACRLPERSLRRLIADNPRTLLGFAEAADRAAGERP